jgi:hypothetical protein
VFARMIAWQLLQVTKSAALVDQLVVFCPQAGLFVFSQCILRRDPTDGLLRFNDMHDSLSGNSGIRV